MLSAIRQSDLLKVIGDSIKKDKSEIYTCAFCKKQVTHHKGMIVIGHFKHRHGEAHCPNKGESLVHLNIKLAIYQYLNANWFASFKVLEVEKWLFNNSMRPDIYIETKKGNKIALEIQATPITIEQLINRTSKFTRKNIYVAWILPFDSNRFLSEKYDYKSNSKIPVPAGHLKLKSFELFMYYAFYKKLTFWDLDQNKSAGFTIVELDEHFGKDVYLLKKGEGHFFSGRKSKTIKKILNIHHHIGFNQFKLTRANRYQPLLQNIEIPSRKIFHFWKNE